MSRKKKRAFNNVSQLSSQSTNQKKMIVDFCYNTLCYNININNKNHLKTTSEAVRETTVSALYYS
jgi:hypothetical protein